MVTNSPDNEKISVIIRTSGGRFSFLEQSLFSVYCDRYPRKQVIVIYRGEDPVEVGKIKALNEVYAGLELRVINNYYNKSGIELGFGNSDGRYICFLNDHEIFFQNHLSPLIKVLQESDKAWAYSQTVVDIETDGYVKKKIRPFKHEIFSFKRLLQNDYIPLGSIIIDRTRIKEDFLYELKNDSAQVLNLAFFRQPVMCDRFTFLQKMEREPEKDTATIRNSSFYWSDEFIGTGDRGEYLNKTKTVNSSENKFKKKIFKLFTEKIPNYAWFLFNIIKVSIYYKPRSITFENGTRLNVLYVSHTLDRGGIETVTKKLLDELDEKKYNPRFLILNRDGEMAGKIREMGYEVHLLGIPVRYLSSLRAMQTYMIDKKIDIMHYNGNNLESVPVRLAAIFSGVPIIVSHIHSTHQAHMRRWKDTSYYDLISRHTGKVIAVSNQVAGFIHRNYKIKKEKIITVYNGIDSNLFKPAENKTDIKRELGLQESIKTVCIAGRVTWEKGHEILINALNLLKNKYEFYCIICGTGDKEEEISKLINECGLGDKIIFLGFRDDLHRILNAADIFVQPSILEGFGVTIIEAMAMRLPVIATEVGGIPEIIDDGINGFLIPPESPAALADKIEFLFENESIAKAIGERAREDVIKRFSCDAFSGKIDAVYQELVK